MHGDVQSDFMTRGVCFVSPVGTSGGCWVAAAFISKEMNIMNRVLRRALPGVLAMLLAMTSGAQADLVGLWRFDNNQSPQPDSSGKGGNGVLVGDVR
jgi:hypothetical protein